MQVRKRPVVVEAEQWTGDEAAMAAFLGIDPVVWRDAIIIDTLEGRMNAQRGDWIIRGVTGEYYPIKPGIFAATYEAVEPE